MKQQALGPTMSECAQFIGYYSHGLGDAIHVLCSEEHTSQRPGFQTLA